MNHDILEMDRQGEITAPSYTTLQKEEEGST